MKQMLLTLTALVGILSNGCASRAPDLTFDYHFYYIDVSSNTLLGYTSAADLPLSTCATKQNETGHACVVFLKADFERLYQDYLEK
jgi:hypothetical protein